jgi:hypothetical protein
MSDVFRSAAAGERVRKTVSLPGAGRPGAPLFVLCVPEDGRARHPYADPGPPGSANLPHNGVRPLVQLCALPTVALTRARLALATGPARPKPALPRLPLDPAQAQALPTEGVA